MGKGLADLKLVDELSRDPSPNTTRPSSAIAPTPPDATPTPVMLPRSVTAFLPSRGFFRSYVEDAYPLSEAAAEAHLLAAIVTGSALVGKKVWIANWGRNALYLNIWAVLVGISTLARKSTTVGLAEDIIQDVQADLRLPDDATGAALIDLLHVGDERVWFLAEFGSLIAQCEATYNVAMAKQIATLFDVPKVWEVARKGTKKVSVARPYVALLGATTPSWLTSHLNEADLLGGLYGRFLYMPLPDTGRILPIPPKADPARYAHVLDLARRLSTYEGTISLDRISAPYDRWYRAHHKEYQGLEDGERLGSFWGRLQGYVLKIAALHQLALAAAESGTPPADHVFVIQPESLDLAIALVEHLKKGLVGFVRQKLTTNKIAAAQQKVLGIVRSAGGRVKRRDVQRKANLLPDDFRKIMQGLEEDGRLTTHAAPTESGQTELWVTLGDEADG